MTFTADALADQHIFISGGLGAIGMAVVAALARHGARVCVNDIQPAQAGDAALDDAGLAREAVRYIYGDLTQKSHVETALDAAEAHFGPVTAALCHAGMVKATPLVDYAEADWDALMDVNLKAAFLLGQSAARRMIAHGIAGQLIFTTSWVGAVPWPEIGPYSASKAAMNMLMRTFARELADKRIRANCVAPGIVGAGMALRQWNTEPDYRRRASRAIPLGELQTPESVADAFVFLCSPASRYMTGSVLLVDGGCSLYPMD
jgi:NAD(P)-dependent dehydrogenase (short-subunit alcohol dehydrogenase family)